MKFYDDFLFNFTIFYGCISEQQDTMVRTYLLIPYSRL